MTNYRPLAPLMTVPAQPAPQRQREDRAHQLNLRRSTVPQQLAIARLILPQQLNLKRTSLPQALAILRLILPQQHNHKHTSLPRQLAIPHINLPRQAKLLRFTVPPQRAIPRLALPQQHNHKHSSLPKQLALQRLVFPLLPNLRQRTILPPLTTRRHSLPKQQDAKQLAPSRLFLPQQLARRRRIRFLDPRTAPHLSHRTPTGLPIPQPAELASSPTRGVLPHNQAHPAPLSPWDFRLAPVDPDEEEEFGTPVHRYRSPPGGGTTQEPPSPAWARSLSPGAAPPSKASSVSNPAEDVVPKWTRRMTRLLVNAPDPNRATDEQMADWLQQTEGFLHTMDNWVSTDLSGMNLYLLHLEEFLLKHVARTAQRLKKKAPRPRKGYKRLPIDDNSHTLMRSEIALMKRHATLPATQLISACQTPQQLIDEIARNRVWDTPYFGGWNSPEERQQVEANQTYFDMFHGGDIEFFEEARGPILQEAVFLLAWHVFDQFPDPLPRREIVADIFNWSDIEAELMRESADGRSLWNYDLYSCLFIDSIQTVNQLKPQIGNADIRRLQQWFEHYHTVVGDTVHHHAKFDSPYTVEMARPIIDTTQHALVWLAHTEDVRSHIIPKLPRVLLEQTQMRDADGAWIGRRAPPLTRDMLLQKRARSMEMNEFHYWYGQYTAHSRNAPRVTEHPAPPADEQEQDQEQEEQEEEQEGDEDAHPAEDGMLTDSSRRTSEPEGPLRRRRSRMSVHPEADELACPIWEFPTYDLDHFPSFSQVKKNGISVISDVRLPGDFTPLTSSAVSIKRYDPEGNRTYDPKAKEKAPDATKFAISIIDDIISNEWFSGGQDFPGNVPGEPTPPFHWVDLQDAQGLRRSSKLGKVYSGAHNYLTLHTLQYAGS
ncbi:hypothetical protein CALCODRAFT_538835 [Calocera cornea HHB12733]|uniref:Uncharacterized protein n=1 Tax=Calocera cornea HHB12733 TaxID=1353952 RepID=A0A165C0A5_9BASI|nr:hypothetical protein CALCODRAFT_538835 [Calocera cornea HHB12733]